MVRRLAASPAALPILLLLAARLAAADGSPIRYDVSPRAVSLIEAGTEIEERAPRGWSHLIMRSHPRIAPEEKRKVNATTADLASFLFTAVAARVEPYDAGGETRYRFRDFGVGFGANVKGRLTILSPTTHRDLQANLGFLQARVLATVYEEQKKGTIIAHSDTMAIIDTHVALVRDGRHLPTIYRYALMIDPRNGALAALLWPIAADEAGNYLGAADHVRWLAPNYVEDAVLNVDLDEFSVFGIPSNLAFAVAEMPPGRMLTWPDGVAALASLRRFDEETAYAAEMWLWEMLRRTKK